MAYQTASGKRVHILATTDSLIDQLELNIDDRFPLVGVIFTYNKAKDQFDLKASMWDKDGINIDNESDNLILE